MFSAVGTSQRRSVLATLSDEHSAISEQELALALAGNNTEVPSTDGSREKIQTIRTNLHHTQLPLLEDSGLIEWNREDETVTTTDHSAFKDPQFQQLLETEGKKVDDAMAGLANKRRRLILAILRETRASMSKTGLARRIYQQENDETEPTQTMIEPLVVALSHVHLPQLSDTEIIDYNDVTGRVAYTNHLGLEEVITHFQRPQTRVVSRFDNFLGGLLSTYTSIGKSADDPFGWPLSWSDSSHG
ncbi:hypothetical protein GCM10025751_54960 [Haladaptatus pallidirubidus]|uniref:DUF7344 domain-containing protein n=2 Tax=Haladaptatus pallidirubidus TaxID=1008152 RepID=A0AAV3URF5_9EURY